MSFVYMQLYFLSLHVQPLKQKINSFTKLVIKFCHQAIITIFGSATGYTFLYKRAQYFKLLAIILKFTQPSTNHFASRAITPISHLSGNKLIKMFTQANTCIFSHRSSQKYRYLLYFGIKAITSQSTQTSLRCAGVCGVGRQKRES